MYKLRQIPQFRLQQLVFILSGFASFFLYVGLDPSQTFISQISAEKDCIFVML